MTFHRHTRHMFVSKVSGLMIVFLLLSFALAFVESIWALYLYSFVENLALIGIISSVLMFLAFILYFALIPFFESQTPTKSFLASLILYGVVYIFFAINKNMILFIFLSLLITVARVLKVNSIGLIIRNVSSSKTIGKTEGMMYNITNIAWLVGPLVAGLLADMYSLSIVFYLASFFILMATISFILFRMTSKMPKVDEVDSNLWENAKDFFSNKNVLKAYAFKGGVGMFLATLYVYMPIHIVQSGLGVQWVGYFLFAIVAPLVALEYFLGKKVEVHGYKTYFMIGFGALSFLSFVTGFFSNIFVVMGLLVLANVFLAFLEPTSEAYFFKVTKKKDEGKYYGPFCTSTNLFGTIGRLLSAGVVFILPFNWIFVLLGVEMGVFFLIAVSIKRVVKRKHVLKDILIEAPDKK